MKEPKRKPLWQRILELMSDGQWHTPMSIRVSLKLHGEKEITARIREIRQNGVEVECKVVRDTWRYRLKMTPLKVAA